MESGGFFRYKYMYIMQAIVLPRTMKFQGPIVVPSGMGPNNPWSCSLSRLYVFNFFNDYIYLFTYLLCACVNTHASTHSCQRQTPRWRGRRITNLKELVLSFHHQTQAIRLDSKCLYPGEQPHPASFVHGLLTDQLSSFLHFKVNQLDTFPKLSDAISYAEELLLCPSASYQRV